jgi:nucleotide-binding universal stress UspA family protein
MKNILVPIDFSNASHNASEYAAALASAFNARLIFLNTYLPPVPLGEVPAVLLVSEAQLQEDNEMMMKREIEELGKKYPVPMDSYVYQGNSADTIHQMAIKHKADVIVMGMKGKGKSSVFFGSTTTAVIRKTTVPVLVIPETVTYKPIYNISFASDFGERATIDQYALLHDFAEKYNSFIQILHVQKNELVMSAGEVAGKMKTDLAFTDNRHGFFTIEDADVEHGIRSFIKGHPTDMLAMLAHRHNIFSRIFGTVHTKEMSYQTNTPLLVLQDK